MHVCMFNSLMPQEASVVSPCNNIANMHTFCLLVLKLGSLIDRLPGSCVINLLKLDLKKVLLLDSLELPP